MSGRRSAALAALAVAGALAAAPLHAGLHAQRRPVSRAPGLEGRVDLLAARATTVHAGAGVLWPVGRYVRAGLVAGGGVTRRERAGEAGLEPVDESVGSARAEVVARFVVDPLADPFRPGPTRPRWLLYGGAGGGVLVTRGDRPQTRVFVALGVAGPDQGGWRPALELGLGGGVRVGLALRTGGPGGGA